MLDERTAVSEFRHRVAKDFALIIAVLSRRRRQMHVLSSGEILDEAIDAVGSLSLLYRQLHERSCNDDLVDVGRHLARIESRMDTGYLSGFGIALYVKAPAALVLSSLAHDLALIVLELVTKAARHSEARRVGVELSTQGERWNCSVPDGGIGLGIVEHREAITMKQPDTVPSLHAAGRGRRKRKVGVTGVEAAEKRSEVGWKYDEADAGRLGLEPLAKPRHEHELQFVGCREPDDRLRRRGIEGAMTPHRDLDRAKRQLQFGPKRGGSRRRFHSRARAHEERVAERVAQTCERHADCGWSNE